MQRATNGRERSRRPGLRGLVVVAVAIAAGCGGTSPPPVPTAIVIGATLPLTGHDAARARAMQRGYEDAVAAVNAAGGVRVGLAPVRVTLDLRDDSADAAALETATQALVEAGAHVVIATPADVRAVAQAGITERAGLPLVGNAIDHPGLPGKRMQWMVLAAAASPNPEARAREVVSATLAAIARAGSLDPRAIRAALQEPQTSR